MAETKTPRSLEAIDRNLALICDAKTQAIANRDAALRRVEDAERQALNSEFHVATCEQRITELLDERLRAQ